MLTFTGIKEQPGIGGVQSAGAANPVVQGSTIAVKKGQKVHLNLPLNPQYGDIAWVDKSPAPVRARIGTTELPDRARDRAFRMHSNGTQSVELDTSQLAPGRYQVRLERHAHRGVLERLNFHLQVSAPGR